MIHDLLLERVPPVWKHVYKLGSDRHQDGDPENQGE
jgi:hypothetical protein